MKHAAWLVLAAALAASAPAGASGRRPVLALTAIPARVALAGSGHATVRVVNPGVGPVVVDVGRAGFSLDRRGRPKVAPRAKARSATSWLTVRPRRFLLRPGRSQSLAVASRLPRGAEPGDHDALVLLTTRPRHGPRVAVRVRMGIVVVVRAPGRVVRRVIPKSLQVRRAHGGRVLELLVVNHGNVTETLDRARVRVVLRHGNARAWLRAEARELRPRTSGVVRLRYRGLLRGRATVRVRIALTPGRPAVSRTFRVSL